MIVTINTRITDTGKEIAEIAVNDIAVSKFNGVKETELELSSIKIVSYITKTGNDGTYVLLITNVYHEHPYILYAKTTLPDETIIPFTTINGQSFDTEYELYVAIKQLVNGV